MEAFAGYTAQTDHEVGRLLDALEDIGQLDNTLVFYMIGDNGASLEGGLHGVFNEMSSLNGVPEDLDRRARSNRRDRRAERLQPLPGRLGLGR